MPGAGGEADGGVAAARVQDAGRAEHAHAREQALVLEREVLLDLLPAEALDRLVRLHRHQRARHERALPHDVLEVRAQAGQQEQGFPVAGARAGDAQGHGGALPHVGVVALGEVRDHARQLLGRLEEQEADVGDGGAAHVRVDVGDGHVQQAAERAVVGGAGVGEAEHVHRAEAEQRVLRGVELVDEGVGVLLAAVHDEREAEPERADDLVVLRLAGVGEHFLDGGGVAAARHDEPHAPGGGLAHARDVGVEQVLELLVDVLLGRGERDQAQPEREPVQRRLLLALVRDLEQQLLGDRVVVAVGVREAERVEGAAVGVGAGALGAARQVVAQHGLELRVREVDHPDARRRLELRPVGGLGHPLEVLAEEVLVRRARAHRRRRPHHRAVLHRLLRVHAYALHQVLAQHQPVRLAPLRQELLLQRVHPLPAQQLLHPPHARPELLRVALLRHHRLPHFREERLVLVFEQVHGDLEGPQHLAGRPSAEQLLQQRGSVRRLAQEELALGEREVVVAAALLGEHEVEQTHHLHAEGLVFDGAVRQLVGVLQGRQQVGRAQQALSELVETTGVDGDPHGLLDTAAALREAASEELLDDLLQAGRHLALVGPLSLVDLPAHSDKFIHALGQHRPGEVVTRCIGDIEELLSLQSQAQGFLVLFQMVEDLERDEN